MRRAIVLFALATAACSVDLPTRSCAVDGDCVKSGETGRCVASPSSGSSWCAFSDGTCAGGDRFGALAGDGLAGVCVGGELPDAGQGPDAGCPGTTEVCDGIDNDCNDLTDEAWPELGDPCSAGVGACEATGSLVCSPTQLTTECDAVPGTPAAMETCDNDVDDDCNGSVDDGCPCTPGTSRSCGTDVGACEFGMQDCDGTGVWGPCMGGVAPGIEACNNMDDDCDGSTDEALVQSCGTDVGDCVSGTQTCSAGVWGACGGSYVGPATEDCDGGDEDCDGMTDNGCSCTEGAMQSCGTNVGECTSGTQTCSGGTWGSCVGEVGPATETCNGLDDDCDGPVDEGFSLGVACDGADGDLCNEGSTVCDASGGVTCSDASGTNTEACNGTDDDCDGEIDEGFALGLACDGADSDMCAEGVTVCNGAGTGTQCNDTTGNSTEVCDGTTDEDCDGTIDEGCACVNGSTQSCGTDTGACVAGTQTCSGGAWGACMGSVGPVAETCNGLDDDCDGMTDEDYLVGTACDGSDGDLCAEGVTVCNATGTGTICNDTTGTNTEDCNGVDDDCDGSTDEDFALGGACDGSDTDLCLEGVVVCSAVSPTMTACNDTTSSTTEVCGNGLDDDCDGSIDEGCLSPPILRSPWNGQATGSVHASPLVGVRPRRPRFVWTSVPGASSYDLRVDDSCTTPGFATCGFASPEISVNVGTASYTPVVDLAVSTVAPVGRRYYWRVRSCDAGGSCSAWSAVRYVDVARLPDDYNGDGYSDMLASTPYVNSNSGAVYLFQGPFNAVIDATFSGTTGERLGWSVASAGDVNADGFADIIVGATTYAGSAPNTGRALLYLGGSTVNTVEDATFVGSSADDNFGESVAGAGDVNGDGFADLIIGATQTTAASGYARVYFGSATPLDTGVDGTFTGVVVGTEFGRSVSGAGDVNGDGFADLLVGAPDFDSPTTNAGRVYFYLGGTPLDTTADATISGSGASDQLGWSVANAGDVNFDGFCDIVVGSPNASATGRAQVYYGSATFDTTSDGTLNGPTTGSNFGLAVSTGGDMNGDGFSDVLVGAQYAPAAGTGCAYIYLGGSGTSINTTSDGVFCATDSGYLGTSVGSLGDLNGDGFGDIIAGAPCADGGCPGMGAGYATVWLGNSGTSINTTSDGTVVGLIGGGEFGTAVGSHP